MTQEASPSSRPSSNTPSRRRVAVSVRWKFVFGQKVTGGIMDYANLHSDWDVTLINDRASARVVGGSVPFDGIIADPADSENQTLLKNSDIPIVAIANTAESEGLPAVHSDETAIGEMAGRHLLELGLQSFAFCGLTQPIYSKQRRTAFVRLLAREGVAARIFEYEVSERSPTATQLRRLADWLESLPRPTGLFCVSDFAALNVIQALRQTGINVPQDLALIGVDNEPAVETVYRFPLTSIEQNLEVIGWEAAALLDRRMKGEDVSNEPILIPPQRVVRRASTETIAVEDEVIAKAVRIIQENACRRFNVEELLEEIPLSLSALERRFKKSLGRSPQAEIMRLRLEKAKDLLLSTNLSMQEIAEEIGYNEQRKLTILLKTKLGMSPSAFRKQHRRAYADTRTNALI